MLCAGTTLLIAYGDLGSHIGFVIGSPPFFARPHRGFSLMGCLHLPFGMAVVFGKATLYLRSSLTLRLTRCNKSLSLLRQEVTFPVFEAAVLSLGLLFMRTMLPFLWRRSKRKLPSSRSYLLPSGTSQDYALTWKKLPLSLSVVAPLTWTMCSNRSRQLGPASPCATWTTALRLAT